MPIARKRKHHYDKSLLKCLRSELFGVDDCRQLLLQDYSLHVQFFIINSVCGLVCDQM